MQIKTSAAADKWHLEEESRGGSAQKQWSESPSWIEGKQSHWSKWFGQPDRWPHWQNSRKKNQEQIKKQIKEQIAPEEQIKEQKTWDEQIKEKIKDEEEITPEEQFKKQEQEEGTDKMQEEEPQKKQIKNKQIKNKQWIQRMKHHLAIDKQKISSCHCAATQPQIMVVPWFAMVRASGMKW